jgi:photosystem II stability/assembly factor-like uncharacterized protein
VSTERTRCANGYATVGAREVLLLNIQATGLILADVLAHDSTGQSGALLAIACNDTRTCYAVGENRYILHTDNAGVHWNKEPSGAQTALDAISCRHGIARVAVGSSGTVVSN